MATKVAATSSRAPRTIGATTRICRRDHLSMKTPTKGPRTLYGSSSTARPIATWSAVVCFSGLKKAKPTTPNWKIPSENCETSRVENNRLKSRPFRTVRRSAA
ncbi:hypothetical protein [Nonomuraea dietziae]|uniref:hypothetical protein n=1 Tax=Nonomuraea dietziae TaxID=65515 RepID=UPI0031D80CAD